MTECLHTIHFIRASLYHFAVGATLSVSRGEKKRPSEVRLGSRQGETEADSLDAFFTRRLTEPLTLTVTYWNCLPVSPEPSGRAARQTI